MFTITLTIDGEYDYRHWTLIRCQSIVSASRILKELVEDEVANVLVQTPRVKTEWTDDGGIAVISGKKHTRRVFKIEES